MLPWCAIAAASGRERRPRSPLTCSDGFPSTASANIDIAIIGAGEIGLACILELARAGREIVLFDTAPGCGASFGKAGGITPGWVAPTATPATLRALPRMLMDPLSPLLIRPSCVQRLLPWLLHFALAAWPSRVGYVS